MVYDNAKTFPFAIKPVCANKTWAKIFYEYMAGHCNPEPEPFAYGTDKTLIQCA
jgi:hypothetical protein